MTNDQWLLLDNIGCNVNRDAAADTGCSWTLLLVRRDSPFGRLSLLVGNANVVVNAHPRNPQNAIDRFDIAFDPGGCSARLPWNLTHLQCAC